MVLHITIWVIRRTVLPLGVLPMGNSNASVNTATWAKYRATKGIARKLIWWGIRFDLVIAISKTYVNVPHVNTYHIEAVLGHRRRTTIFKVYWFGGIYSDIPPSLDPWERYCGGKTLDLIPVRHSRGPLWLTLTLTSGMADPRNGGPVRLIYGKSVKGYG